MVEFTLPRNSKVRQRQNTQGSGRYEEYQKIQSL